MKKKIAKEERGEVDKSMKRNKGKGKLNDFSCHH
jgi:hypothetical protein